LVVRIGLGLQENLQAPPSRRRIHGCETGGQGCASAFWHNRSACAPCSSGSSARPSLAQNSTCRQWIYPPPCRPGGRPGPTHRKFDWLAHRKKVAYCYRVSTGAPGQTFLPAAEQQFGEEQRQQHAQQRAPELPAGAAPLAQAQQVLDRSTTCAPIDAATARISSPPRRARSDSAREALTT